MLCMGPLDKFGLGAFHFFPPCPFSPSIRSDLSPSFPSLLNVEHFLDVFWISHIAISKFYHISGEILLSAVNFLVSILSLLLQVCITVCSVEISEFRNHFLSFLTGFIIIFCFLLLPYIAVWHCGRYSLSYNICHLFISISILQVHFSRKCVHVSWMCAVVCWFVYRIVYWKGMDSRQRSAIQHS